MRQESISRQPAQAAVVIPLRPQFAPVRLERADALAQVTNDWLYQQCSDEGRAKLLQQHELLAA